MSLSISHSRQMLWHSFITIGGAIIIGAINFLFNIITSRLLSKSEFGIFGAVMSLFYIWTIMAMAISLYGNRLYRYKDQFPPRSYCIKFFWFGIASATFLVSFSPILGQLNGVQWYYVALLGFFALLSPLASYLSGVATARKLFFEVSLVGLFSALAKIFFGIGLVWWTGKLWTLFVGLILAQIFQLVLSAILVRDDWQTSKKGPALINRTFFYTAIVLGLQNYLFAGDILAANRFLSDDFAGDLTALTTFGKIILWIAVSFSSVLFSYVVHSHSEDTQSPIKKLLISINMSSLLCLIIGLMLWWQGPWLMEVIFGSDYREIGNSLGVIVAPLLVYNVFHTLVQFSLTDPHPRHAVFLGLLFIGQNIAFWTQQDRLDLSNIYYIQFITFLIGSLLFAGDIFKLSSRKFSSKQQAELKALELENM